MSYIPKKVKERLSQTVGKYQRILKDARTRDVNESDTVLIITDILAEVFGFEKFQEITSEFVISNTYCDLAIKIKDKVEYLIEAKAIGVELKDSHLHQAIGYGSREGINWIVLTNGVNWNIYRLRFGKPISYDLVCSFDFLAINTRKTEDQEKLYIMCKTGIHKGARKEFHERTQSVNRFVIGALTLGENVVNAVRRDLKKLSPGVKVDNAEIQYILENEVIKRDVLDGDDASKAKSRVKKLYKKAKKESKPEKPVAAPPPAASETPTGSE